MAATDDLSLGLDTACGSVGLAAVQLSQMVGAEVGSTLKAVTGGIGS